MGDRTQRMKGKANEAGGKMTMEAGLDTGSGKKQAKGAARTAKGKTQQAAGKAKSTTKKATR